MTSSTYSDARARLASLMDDVTDNREVVRIRRRGREDVALIAASELDSLLELAHLMRSPRNAERLLSALGRAMAWEGEPSTLEEAKRETGLEPSA